MTLDISDINTHQLSDNGTTNANKTMTMSSPPELPTEEASSPNRISSPRVAETILRESAADIGFNDDEHLDEIMIGFRNQYITEEWQLSMLGDGHWERFMRFMKRYAEANGMGYQDSN